MSDGITDCYRAEIDDKGYKFPEVVRYVDAQVQRIVVKDAAPEQKEELKPTNPKDMIGSDKLPLHLWPNTATAQGALALLDGALKYGRNNFRAVGVRKSIYVAALKRHIMDVEEGLEVDEDSGLDPLAHILACAAILVEAKAQGNLVNDANYGGQKALEYTRSLTPHVKRLKDKHKDKNPKHYTISDN
jgi:hypothetical protein